MLGLPLEQLRNLLHKNCSLLLLVNGGYPMNIDIIENKQIGHLLLHYQANGFITGELKNIII